VKVEQAVELIRSLNSRVRILSRNDASLTMHVDSVRIDGRDAAGVIEFLVPSGSWAGEWDAAEKQWRSRPDLATPNEGRIDEAFIKPAGDGFALSFAERCEPLVRWGFFTEAVRLRSGA
jgi:hypothetical protein